MMAVNFNPFPVLETNRLKLRKIADEDAAQIFALRSNQEVMRHIDRPLAGSIGDAMQLIRKINDALNSNEGITWAISYLEETELIGTIGFWSITNEHYRAEIGYMLHIDHHDKGIMQEALSAVLDYGFKNMLLHSVEANVNPANAASIRLLERNKFILEGRFRENYYYNGKFLDSFVFSLLTPRKQ